MSSFIELPAEIICMIARLLTWPQLIALMQVHSRFYSIVTSIKWKGVSREAQIFNFLYRNIKPNLGILDMQSALACMIKSPNNLIWQENIYRYLLSPREISRLGYIRKDLLDYILGLGKAELIMAIVNNSALLPILLETQSTNGILECSKYLSKKNRVATLYEYIWQLSKKYMRKPEEFQEDDGEIVRLLNVCKPRLTIYLFTPKSEDYRIYLEPDTNVQFGFIGTKWRDLIIFKNICELLPLDSEYKRFSSLVIIATFFIFSHIETCWKDKSGHCWDASNVGITKCKKQAHSTLQKAIPIVCKNWPFMVDPHKVINHAEFAPVAFENPVFAWRIANTPILARLTMLKLALDREIHPHYDEILESSNKFIGQIDKPCTDINLAISYINEIENDKIENDEIENYEIENYEIENYEIENYEIENSEIEDFDDINLDDIDE